MPVRRAKASSKPVSKASKASTKNATKTTEKPVPAAEIAPNEAESSREFILHAAQDRHVKFVRLWFTDILGMLKSTAIVADELEAALDEGITFDGSAIEGYARQDESDMIARPDQNTFTVLPSHSRELGV